MAFDHSQELVPFRFLDLPAEIRTRVYKFALPSRMTIPPVERRGDRKKEINTAVPSFEAYDRPRFMFANRLMYQEVNPLFWAGLTVDATYRSRDADGPQLILDQTAIEQIQHLRLWACDLWHDVLAHQVLMHSNLKTVHFDLDWDHIFDTSEIDDEINTILTVDLKTYEAPLLLSSIFVSLCRVQLYEIRSGGPCIGYDTLCKRFSITFSLIDCVFMVCKQVPEPEDRVSYINYGGHVSITSNVNTGNLELDLDSIEVCRHHTTRLATRPEVQEPLSVADQAGGWDEFRLGPCLAEEIFSILIYKELERQDLLKNIACEPCSSHSYCGAIQDT